MNTIGNKIKITFFGESHSSYIGVTIDNLPSGIKIDEELIRFNLSKRRPHGEITTNRIERDNYQIISGFLDGYTTGAALTVLIENTNRISGDYKNLTNIPRPSHADYPAHIKYDGKNDKRGGGFFSGRLTALWCIVGSISQQILEKNNIYVGSHILSLKDVIDSSFDMNTIDKNEIVSLNKKHFAVLDDEVFDKMNKLALDAKNNLDSVGGVVESKIINLPIGIGEPYFLSVESYISSLLFSVPGVKGVEFGKGFDITKHFGSEMNDQYRYIDNDITTLSNNNGGILGGLSTGRPIIVRTAMKPTSSIARKQKSIDLSNESNVDLVIKGRHDPQIVSRGTHVINCVLYYAILDLIMLSFEKDVIL
jgi:chorismate synthase